LALKTLRLRKLSFKAFSSRNTLLRIVLDTLTSKKWTSS